MQEYICHKRVRAGRIEMVEESRSDGSLPLRLEGGEVFYAMPVMLARYRPVPGDYLVEYEDGYRSISPRKAFEDGYSPVESGAQPKAPAADAALAAQIRATALERARADFPQFGVPPVEHILERARSYAAFLAGEGT